MVTTIGSSIWPNWTGIPALPLPSCEVRRRKDTQPASSPGKWSSQEDQHRRVQKARWAVTEGSPGARHSSKPQFQNVLLHYTHRLSSTVQEKGSERLLAISLPGSPIPTSAQWNHKCTHLQSLGGETIVFSTYMKTQNECKMNIKNFRAVMQGKVSKTKGMMCLLRLAIHEAGPISNTD